MSFCVVEDDGVQVRLPLSLANHSVAAAQAAATQAATIAQVAALEQLRNKLESGEPPEKKIALPMEDHQRLLQRALQHNLLAMTAQIPMNIRINNQGIDTLTFWPTDGPNMAIVGLCSVGSVTGRSVSRLADTFIASGAGRDITAMRTLTVWYHSRV